MDFLEAYMNRWVAPIIMTLVFLWFCFKKKLFLDWIKNKKNSKSISILEVVIDCLKIEFGNWKQNVLLPAILAIGLLLFISWIFGIPLTSYREPLWFAVLTSGFLNPISEEVMTRGIGLGVTFTLLARLVAQSRRINNPKLVKYGVYVFGLLFTSYVFVFLGHDNNTLYQSVSRFSASMLWGVLYLVSKKNLLPSIVAHAAYNLFLIFWDMPNIM